MPRFSNAELALAALLMEAAIGYPAVVYRAIGHPVTWMGALIDAVDARFNRPCFTEFRRLVLGCCALVGLLAATAAATETVRFAVGGGAMGMALLVLAASSLPAQNSLRDHVRAVADALDHDGGDLTRARSAVARIVGRDPERLDASGVARAAIESLAENFADGIVAPAFWIGVAGLTGGALYKAVNTADSMIGHRTARHEAFGWAAARLDDLVNLPASRLAALLLTIGAMAVGASASGAARAIRRDASRHRSPNAGWPEAAMAGALGLRLAGPRVYHGTTVADAFMGDGTQAATAADIRRALRLYNAACVAAWLALAAIVLISLI